MRIDKGEKVFTAEGDIVGEVERVVLDPKTKEVTHIVVGEGGLFEEERVVPINIVESSRDERMMLRETPVDFDAFPVFEEIRYTPLNEKDRMIMIGPLQKIRENYSHFQYPPLTGMSMSDQGAFRNAQIKETVENIPTGTLALREGAIVRDVDGKRFGRVERILTEAEDDQITYFVVSRGVVFKKKVLVPYEWVMSITEDEIRLAMGPTILNSLPTFRPNGSSS